MNTNAKTEVESTKKVINEKMSCLKKAYDMAEKESNKSHIQSAMKHLTSARECLSNFVD